MSGEELGFRVMGAGTGEQAVTLKSSGLGLGRLPGQGSRESCLVPISSSPVVQVQVQEAARTRKAPAVVFNFYHNPYSVSMLMKKARGPREQNES